MRMPERQQTNTTEPVKVTRQESIDAARAVAAHCLLPDPRSVGTKAKDGFTTFWRPMHWESLEQCAKYEIKGTTHGVIDTKNNKVMDADAFEDIMKRARQLTIAGASQCQVRDFNDTYVVPQRYLGYRGADNQCHITHDEAEANIARCAYDQFEKPANKRLFLPSAPRRADANGKCTP